MGANRGHRALIGEGNIAGFLDRVLALIKREAGEVFVAGQQRQLMIIERDPSRLLARLSAYEAPKHLERGVDCGGKYA